MIYILMDSMMDIIVAVKSERIGAIRLMDRLVEWCGSEDWDRFEIVPMPIDENDKDIVSRVSGADRDKIDFSQAPTSGKAYSRRIKNA